jgi:hypothetical protein
MFERFTENARRTIFFARYEAAQVNSPFIETEHLLLGLMRAQKNIFISLLKIGTAEEIQREIRSQMPPTPQMVTTSVDLPLSNQSKRVLAYAAEESERLHDRHIGPEHLLLGLLREKDATAAEILQKHGATLPEFRELMRKTPLDRSSDRGEISSRDDPDTTYIHGERLNVAYLENLAVPLRRFAWVKQDWQPRDLLIEKATGRVMFYAGQNFDEQRFTLAKGAWPRDHCALCRWELNRTSPERQAGYTNGMEWLCAECYERFVAPPLDPTDEFYT